MASLNGSSSYNGMYFYNFTTQVAKQSTSNEIDGQLMVDSTSYRCCGADVSVPSENLAFYFGGLTASDGGPILYTANHTAGHDELGVPNRSSNDLTICSLDREQPVCMYQTSPAGIQPRAESELVWLPYGTRGILLSLGGIIMPSDLEGTGLNPVYNSTNGTNNYMTSLLIFDIASSTWTSQQSISTNNEIPSQRAAFCSVARA